MTHVKTAPYYPRSNAKIERWHKTIKGECLRPQTPLSVEDVRRIVPRYVERYNTVRLHRSIGYVTPRDALDGRHEAIFADRDPKLAVAREQRKARQAAREGDLAKGVADYYTGVAPLISTANRKVLTRLNH
jgi:putative transposase